MTSDQCYSALGLSPGCHEEQIKQAYRKLAKVNHPDLGGSTEKFVKIQKAYESLMDPANRSKSSRQFTANSGSQSPYWRSWNTGSTWWNGTGASQSSYSSDKDFETDFEEQWRKFTERKGRHRGRSFKSKKDFKDADENDTGDSFDSRDESYRSEKNGSASHGRQSRRSTKASGSSTQSEAIPNRIRLTLEKSTSAISGEYERISKFNGRLCFKSNSNMFIFWSNKNKDWKISESLKDDGNCVAFNDRIHPSIDSPMIIGDSSKWMVWSDRARKFLPNKLLVEEYAEDYSAWTVERLRERLESMGLKEKADRCFDKSELIELTKIYASTSSIGKKRDESRDFSADAPIPEGHYRLCSRQRHDGVVQAPPVLSDRCSIGKNRVEKFLGKLESVEGWLLKHGDRKRYYGAFDSEKQFCFGLIWKHNKVWARAAPHDW